MLRRFGRPARGARSRARPAAEANPRWARRETAVTFTRDNNLFLVPLDGGDRHRRSSPTSQPQKRDPTRDRQPEVHQGRRAEADRAHARRGGEKEEGRREGQGATRCRSSSWPIASRRAICSSRPTARTCSSSSSSAPRRRSGRNVPNYVTESSYTEDIPARTFVGDAQDKRTLAVMNLETGKTCDGRLRRRVWQPARTARRDARRPLGDAADRQTDGALAVAHVRADRQQGSLAGRRRSRIRARPASLDALHDDAWVRELGGFGPNDPSFGWLPDQKHLWFLSERDGWMHLYTVDAARRSPRRAAAHRRASGKSTASALSADRQEVLHHEHRGASGRAAHLLDADRRRRAHEADVDDGRRAPAKSRPTTARSGSIYSSSNKPHEVYLMPNRAGALRRSR